jgi:hypothetical protein
VSDLECVFAFFVITTSFALDDVAKLLIEVQTIDANKSITTAVLKNDLM